jgi:GNAT superfamily N-acetyltransferase
MDFYKIPFSDYVNRLLEFESNPPSHWVPTTIYWAIADGEVVGRIGIRHKLNDFLFKEGGHIGYFIRPSSRGQGYATRMLKQMLETELAQKIGNLLLTCDEDNLPSEKTILKNGGELENVVLLDSSRPPKKRYWIPLNSRIEVKVSQDEKDLDRIVYFYSIFNYVLEINQADTFVVAKMGDRIVGTVRCAFEQNTTVLRGMYVHPSFHRKGIGRMMLGEFKEILQSRATDIAYLICPPHLRRFYGTIGFTEPFIGSVPKFLLERRLSYLSKYGDQVIMKYERPSDFV